MEIVFVRHGESIGNVANEKGINYDPTNINLTNLGIKQAKETGLYIKKTFGKFDKVITSPMLRCAETTELILGNLEYNETVIIDDRLIEQGCDYDILEGLSKDEKNKIIPPNVKLTFEKIDKEPNPFERIKLSKKFRDLRDKTLPYSPTQKEAWENYNNFLYELSTKSYSRVLIISHSQTMASIMQIICGINMSCNWIKIDSFTNKKWMENCSIMCVYYNPETKTYSLVSAPEDSHLSV